MDERAKAHADQVFAAIEREMAALDKNSKTATYEHFASKWTLDPHTGEIVRTFQGVEKARYFINERKARSNRARTNGRCS